MVSKMKDTMNPGRAMVVSLFLGKLLLLSCGDPVDEPGFVDNPYVAPVDWDSNDEDGVTDRENNDTVAMEEPDQSSIGEGFVQDESPSTPLPNTDTPFVEPDWWHHYHSNSRNTDRLGNALAPTALEIAWSWPDRTNRWDTQPGVSSFNGAALASDQQTVYITTSRDGADNFHAIDTVTDDPSRRVLWSFGLSPWATWSSALVDNDDTIFVSDDQSTVALEFPDGDTRHEPVIRWDVEHDHVSMSHGFTPWGEVFEVTIEGQVNVYRREADSDSALIARAHLVRDWEELPLPLGVGLPMALQEAPTVRDKAYPRIDVAGLRRPSCVMVEDFTNDPRQRFLVPGHIAALWEGIAAQELLSSEPTLIQRFYDTSFGGTFASNTPSIVQLDDHTARIFIATMGEYAPPALDDARMDLFDDELLKELFYPHERGEAAEWAALVRPTEMAAGGTYAVDPNPETYCRQIDDVLLRRNEEMQPYLFPAYGVPDNFETILANIETMELVNEMLENGEETKLDDLRARWTAMRALRSTFRSLSRGHYSGYLQIVDFDHRLVGTEDERDALTVHNPIPMPSPSGTSAAITPAEARQVIDPVSGEVVSGDGRQFVVLAAGSRLYAYDVGRADEDPTEEALLTWIWDATLPVGGSPTVFLPQDVGRPEGSGAAVAVLAGFRGVSMVQDWISGDCVEGVDGIESGDCCQTATYSVHEEGEEVPGSAGLCRVLYNTNTQPWRESRPLFGTREERYFGQEATTVAVATSVVEAADDHFYVAFTSGPAHDEFYDRVGLGHWEDFIPRTSEFAVVETRTGNIAQTIPIDEAPVCDSTIGLDGMVYSIHTSGLNQLLHYLFPAIFGQPRGGIVAFEAVRP